MIVVNNMLFTTNIMRGYRCCDWSSKILKFLNNCLQKSSSFDPVVIQIIIFLKFKDVNAVLGISPENYSIGNVRMKVGIVYQSQIMT